MNLKPVKKCVIPIAGYGTRLFPATKATIKALFPIVDTDGITKPIIQIIIEEAIASGIEEVCLVTQNDQHDAVKSYFSEDINETLKQKPDLLAQAEAILELGRRMTYVIQEEQEGFGHAVYCARDFVGDEVEKVRVDSRETYQRLIEFAEKFIPNMVSRVEYYPGERPIFDIYGVEDEIQKALERKVQLKSGGYLIIDQTEAMTTIDVNTGAYVGHLNLEETILKTNLEAVKEIAYQVRLRDAGGIIIVDFIDMEKKTNQEKIFNALNEALKRDRSKTHVLPMSEMGLIQMTRKRVRKPLNRMLCEPCYYCEGEGYLLSKSSICYNIYREILREAYGMMGARLTVKVNPKIAELLHGEENHLVTSVERTIGKQIVIYPNAQFHLEEFDIFEVLKD